MPAVKEEKLSDQSDVAWKARIDGVLAANDTDWITSGVLRPKRTRHLRRTKSEPTGKLQDITSEAAEFNPASPFAEALRKQGELKKRKGALKRVARARYERKRKNNEITQEHHQYSVTYCMMLGIRFSVSRQSPVPVAHEVAQSDNAPGGDLTVEDFMHVDRLVFKPPNPKEDSVEEQLANPATSSQSYNEKSQTEFVPPHLSIKFKFKDYAHDVFRQLRKKFGIDDMEYMLSLCGQYNYIEFISNSKSGQFFFYSNDGHYLIKTQSSSESRFLRQILPQYYRYMMEQKDSLLVRICGMHKVRLSTVGRDMHFVIMKSVYSNAASRKIHSVYDLKGSTLGRLAKTNEPVWKDLDLIRNKQMFKLGPLREKFLEQVKSDAEFLERLQIMDYSLLVGIHKVTTPSVRAPASVDKLTGQASRTVATQQAVKRGSVGDSAQSVRHYRSQTMPRLSDEERAALALSVFNQQKSEPSEGETTPLAVIGATADQIFGPSSPRKKALELEDVNEYYYDSDDSEIHEEKSMFCPVVALDAGGNSLPEIYYFGVIDILQKYNGRKRSENFFKRIIERTESTISAINPRKYANRFVKFVSSHTE
mmetsp:Transcript_2622/g.5091  ORF Transcript_2622/g.5091 Transcript_2622/m.5091 type:complete len:593 (-) Transcript_2622:184-1962(-)